jgi:hypothetical protein
MSSLATEPRRPTVAVDPSAWVRPREARAITLLSIEQLRRLAAGGHVRVHRPPGTTRRYNRDDLLKFAPPA